MFAFDFSEITPYEDSISMVNDFINETSQHDLVKDHNFSTKNSASTISRKRYKVSITKIVERFHTSVLKKFNRLYLRKGIKISSKATEIIKGIRNFKKHLNNGQICIQKKEKK